MQENPNSNKIRYKSLAFMGYENYRVGTDGSFQRRKWDGWQDTKRVRLETSTSIQIHHIKEVTYEQVVLHQRRVYGLRQRTFGPSCNCQPY